MTGEVGNSTLSNKGSLLVTHAHFRHNLDWLLNLWTNNVFSLFSTEKSTDHYRPHSLLNLCCLPANSRVEICTSHDITLGGSDLLSEPFQ